VDSTVQTLRILRDQLPDYFKPVIEFQEIIKAHGYALGGINQKAEQLQDNFYIATCDESTIAYYERLFEIKYRIGDTLDFRRARVSQKFNTIVPFSIGFLRDKLTELYGNDGYSLEVDPVALTLKIKVISDRYGAIDLLYDLLWDVVPAHIRILANQEATNYVPGRVYAAGEVNGILVQTIYQYTVTDVYGEANASGGIVSTLTQTI